MTTTPDATPYTHEPAPPADDGAAESEDQQPDKATTSTKLVRMAEAKFRFGVAEGGEPFAARRDGTSHLAYPLRGGQISLLPQLASEFYEAEGRTASKSALADAMAVLEGKALREPETPVHLRVADYNGSLWIDRCTPEGDVLEVTTAGVMQHTTAPVMFKRTGVAAPMPAPLSTDDPTKPGDPRELFRFLNVSQRDKAPLLAALVASFIPDMQHPIITFSGEQGTGKTTAARLLVSLVDPSAAPTRKPPQNADAFVHTMQGSHVVALDNLSSMPIWLSDSLCRAVTGEADVRRTLYTNDGSFVFKYMKPLILTGIDFAGLRGDLAERLLLVELQRITSTQRRSESELQTEWEAARPRLLGALLQLTAEVRKRLPALQLDELPRMADYAKVLAVVDQLLQTDGLARYSSQSAELAADSLSASPIAERLLEERPDFLGTAAELLKLLRPDDPDAPLPKGWPTKSRAVTTALTKDAPALLKNRWRVDDRGPNREGTKLWHIVAPERVCTHNV